MRHNADKANFGRKYGPRIALLRGLVNSLVEHERIKTTVSKAKELRRHVEKAITLGKKGNLHARRLLLSRYPNDATVEKLVGDLSVRFKTRPGGYTKIIKLGARPGDKAEMAYIQFVDYKLPQADEAETVKGDAGAEKRKRVALRAAGKLRKNVRTLQGKARRVSRQK
ncbi:MAG: 50S ribosomal protein L17 [Bdellovibrionales bacterium]|nr:50S ribosomal protein L17 [Bdellovibrionales bacterium]